MTAPGVEPILARELRGIGIVVSDTTLGGVSFNGKLEHLMRVNLWSRVANRVLVRVDEFHASTFYELERRAKRIPWSRFVSPGQEIRFRVTCRKSKLYHSDAVAERIGQAVVAATGATLAADHDDDDDAPTGSQLFTVRIVHDVCTISADTSGELLHKRGYRQAIAKAPLRETLAAAMLYGSDWDLRSPLVDPMCGSGTIAIEGAMMARKIAPGVARSFAFQHWPEFEPTAWDTILDHARAEVLPPSALPILASDRDAGAVEATVSNAERAGVSNDLDVSQRSVSAVEFPDTPGLIVTNPPYGLRLGESAPLRNLYAQLGKILRESAVGYRLALLSADMALDAQTQVDFKEIFHTTNGGIPVRLIVGEAE